MFELLGPFQNLTEMVRVVFPKKILKNTSHSVFKYTFKKFPELNKLGT
jgi:hypothetical protein